VGLSFELVLSDLRPMMIGMWTIDPIDGTKGFLRGEQYAVCLSFLIDGNPIVGVIGCPNLPHRNNSAKGYIFVAVKDQGSERVSIIYILVMRPF